MGWLKYKNLNILRMELTFLRNKQFFTLCLKWHIFWSYHFVAEVTFKNESPEDQIFSLGKKKDLFCFFSFTIYSPFRWLLGSKGNIYGKGNEIITSFFFASLLMNLSIYNVHTVKNTSYHKNFLLKLEQPFLIHILVALK